MQTHQLDERYGAGSKTLCCLDITPRRLRKMGVTADIEHVTCVICEQIRAARAQTDREVADGSFWKRFED